LSLLIVIFAGKTYSVFIFDGAGEIQAGGGDFRKNEGCNYLVLRKRGGNL
jgi:hypothetical protein